VVVGRYGAEDVAEEGEAAGGISQITITPLIPEIETVRVDRLKGGPTVCTPRKETSGTTERWTQAGMGAGGWTSPTKTVKPRVISRDLLIQ